MQLQAQHLRPGKSAFVPLPVYMLCICSMCAWDYCFHCCLVIPLSLSRSLTMVIDQMEQFSSRLGELSSRVESTHEHTAQGLEQGARHRDEQLRSTSDTLTHCCTNNIRSCPKT